MLPVEPYISLGAFIETYVLAAQGFGYKVVPEIRAEGELIASFKLGAKIDEHPDILAGITKRVSNRNKYSTEPLGAKIVEKIFSKDFDKVAQSKIINREDIEFLAEKTEQAITVIMGNINYRKELGEWVRNNQTRKKDGMPGFTHGVSLIPSFIAKFAIIYASALGPPASHSGDLIRNSSMLAILGFTVNDRLAHIAVGRKYAYMAIMASACGISSSALGASVVDPASRESVTEKFKLDYRPAVILRFGTSKQNVNHSPRWPISDVLN